MRRLYAGCDLHSNSNFIGVIDGEGKRVFKKKVRNDIFEVRGVLRPFREELVGVVVESTYNWYWLVDGLMEDGYRVHLANPSAMQQYVGLKHVDDRDDAFWLVEMLRLGILPEGYIYPREERAVRDLLRKRGHLVRLRSSLVISLQNILSRNLGRKVRVSEVKALREDRVSPLLEGNEELVLAGQVSKESIDHLTRQIQKIERVVLQRVGLKDSYRFLLTLPGVGKILALTIMLETGPVSRFATVGDYVSYCRKVPSEWRSNGKRKGAGNRKNGNRYLSWAYAEASELARRFHPEARAYFNRKMEQTNVVVAHSALAHKLARAGYYVMRDRVPFDPEKLFGGKGCGWSGEPGVGLVVSHGAWLVNRSIPIF
jgi:transposase